jgi:hypothetical protein
MEWQTIYTTTNAFHAEIIKQVLENEVILAVNVNGKDSSYHIGEIFVNAKPEDVIKALELTANFEKENDIE